MRCRICETIFKTHPQRRVTTDQLCKACIYLFELFMKGQYITVLASRYGVIKSGRIKRTAPCTKKPNEEIPS